MKNGLLRDYLIQQLENSSIDESVASNAAKRLQEQGKNVIAHCGDLSEESTCRELVEQTISSFGSLDILIHNAGWVGYQAIEKTEMGFIQRAIDVNILATTWICKHAWKYLKQSSAPRIVFTTSDRAMYQQYAQSGLTAYAAGKMAQVGIMNALSMEGTEYKILVNAVSPVAKTRMWGETGTPDNLKPEWVTPGVILGITFTDLQNYSCKKSNKNVLKISRLCKTALIQTHRIS